MTTTTKPRHADTVPIERLILLITGLFLAVVAVGVFVLARQIADLLP
jgi:hypothetical protein